MKRTKQAGAGSNVVLWVVGVLVALILVVVFYPAPGHHPTPLRVVTLSNARQLAIATQMYHEDNDGLYPYVYATNDDLKATLGPYVKNDYILESINPDGAVFLGNRVVAGVEQESIEVPKDATILFESKDWVEHNGRNCAFADGHAKFIKGFDDRMLEVEFVESASE